MARKQYNDDTKNSALDAIMNGQKIAFVSKEFGIPHQTLRSWMRRAEIKVQKVMPAPANVDKIGELLIKVVAAELVGMEAIVKQLLDKNWIKKQSAEKLAAMYAIISDKNMQKIEAMSGTPDDNPS